MFEGIGFFSKRLFAALRVFASMLLGVVARLPAHLRFTVSDHGLCFSLSDLFFFFFFFFFFCLGWLVGPMRFVLCVCVLFGHAVVCMCDSRWFLLLSCQCIEGELESYE